MTTNDIDAAALTLDLTYFAFDAQGFAVVQDLIDNPPSAAAGLRSTLSSQAPWDSTVIDMGKSTGL